MFEKIEIFYDGMNIEKYARSDLIKGFTTNCSQFSTHSLRNYTQFYEKNKELIAAKPISFQIWDETTETAIQQINAIHAINEHIFVKIPIISTSGAYNTELFQHAIQNTIPVNVTCVYTYDQIDYAYSLFKDYATPVLLSVFAGPISDIGLDPTSYVTYAVNLFRKNSHVKVLWAGCREIYTIRRAEDMGCHIITVPDGVIEKLFVEKTLEELSRERVTKFHTDATNDKIVIR